jgi:hypothetical protein
VFSFLALIDMVRLDSSVVNRRLRPNLDNAFTCTTVQHRSTETILETRGSGASSDLLLSAS